MAKTETIERLLDRTVGHAMFLEPFIAKMGDPRDYEYRGECFDRGEASGECICGHAIRYEFLVHHKVNPEKTAILGSECINNFEFINPQLYNDLVMAVAALEKRLAEAKKKAKEVQQDAEIADLKAVFDVGCAKVESVYQNYASKRSYRNPRPVPNWLYWGFQEIPKNPPQYQRKSTYIAWYKRMIVKLQRLVDNL